MRVAMNSKPTIYGFEAMDDRHVLIASLARKGVKLGPADVRQLRRALFEEDGASRDEAKALFDLERAQKGETCPEWTEFFVECLTGHIVWEARSTGVINKDQAEWLIRETDATRSLNAFALLANVLAGAHRAPQSFVAAVQARAATPEVQAALASRSKLKPS